MNPLLVTPAELAAHLGDPDWLVLDCRHDLMNPDYGPKAYAEGHIPGAVHLHLDLDLSAAKTGRNGRHPLPDAQAAAAALAARGVRRNQRVVLYDDAGHNYTVRAWWTLNWLGHDNCALLDGGYPRWVAEGRPVTRDIATPPAGDFAPVPRLGATVDAHFVLAQHRSPTLRIVDARTPERFRGEQEPIDPVAGHIPGALNRWFKNNLQADGTFKPPAQLAEEFRALLGDVAPAQVIHQCGSGVTACHNLFAMELAGLAGSKLYPGSWSEWVADPARPVAVGV